MVLRSTGTIWKALNGIVCVYKPAEVAVRKLRRDLIRKLVTEINKLDQQIFFPSSLEQLAIEAGSSKDLIENGSTKDPEDGSFKDLVQFDSSRDLIIRKYYDLEMHPAVIGPKYIGEALSISWSNFLGWNTSGVLLFGLKGGTQMAKFVRENRSTRSYHIVGVFGQATDNGFASGKVIERSTWKFIRPNHVDQILSSMQAAHQKKIFEMAGVDMQSKLAYELALQGPTRPTNSKLPIIYGLKCIDFKGPEFTIEVQCINEYETYLAMLIQTIGLKLHSTAHTISIKCIRHSCFTLDHALLSKHWNLEHIMNNIGLCRELLSKNEHLLDQDSAALRQ